jgi:hypothetical protein
MRRRKKMRMPTLMTKAFCKMTMMKVVEAKEKLRMCRVDLVGRQQARLVPATHLAVNYGRSLGVQGLPP